MGYFQALNLKNETEDSRKMKSHQSVVRRLESGRLVYHMSAPTPEFWDRWSLDGLKEDSYAIARTGKLKPFDGMLNHYIPKTGKIIEAGCGNSKIVLSLLTSGYDIEGVEWGKQTVETVLAYFPNLPIRLGDVTALDVPDSYYAGYLSLGVVEHREEGPEPFLIEAYRVLAPSGIALVSVPYFNPLRKLKGWLGFYRRSAEKPEFYQYAYSRKEFFSYLESAGFKILDWSAYSGVKGIKDEVPLMRYILELPYIGRRLRLFLFRSYSVNKLLGHMIVVACQKP